jgi:hypothetical protein
MRLYKLLWATLQYYFHHQTKEKARLELNKIKKFGKIIIKTKLTKRMGNTLSIKIIGTSNSRIVFLHIRYFKNLKLNNRELKF